MGRRSFDCFGSNRDIQAAIVSATTNICKAGSHILSTSTSTSAKSKLFCRLLIVGMLCVTSKRNKKAMVEKQFFLFL
jgi:hypothetical protein